MTFQLHSHEITPYFWKRAEKLGFFRPKILYWSFPLQYLFFTTSNKFVLTWNSHKSCESIIHSCNMSQIRNQEEYREERVMQCSYTVLIFDHNIIHSPVIASPSLHSTIHLWYCRNTRVWFRGSCSSTIHFLEKYRNTPTNLIVETAAHVTSDDNAVSRSWTHSKLIHFNLLVFLIALICDCCRSATDNSAYQNTCWQYSIQQ